MPGPGKGKYTTKAKRSPLPTKNALSSSSDLLILDISESDGWEAVVGVLCNVFNIPDLTTRSGLKKTHVNFEVIQQRLEKAYNANRKNPKITGGIVGIYAKMCLDSILRDKLFKSGLLSKVIPLLEIDSCRHLALRSLALMTHHGGESARKEISRHSPTLFGVIEAHPSDLKAATLVISTLTHSITAITNVDENPDSKALKLIDVPRVLKVMIQQLRDPNASRLLIDHSAGLFAGVTAHCSQACYSNPSLINFLIAGLRSTDITFRATCLGGLFRLHHTTSKPDEATFDPRNLVASVQRRIPGHLSDLVMRYGPDRAELTLTITAARDYQKAMMKCAQDHDICGLGKTLANMILQTEFSITDGAFEVQDPKTGKFSFDSMGLPFTRWIDALPICAKRLRKIAGVSEKELSQADVLGCKYFILKRNIPDALAHAETSLKRNPDHAYSYYVLTLSADHTNGLRAAKKGMKCLPASLTPFLRFQMMQRAVDHAGDLGLRILQDGVAEARWGEGLALMTSALEDAKIFVQEAPPDNRHMKSVLQWFILLSIALKGPEMSEDLSGLRCDAHRKIKYSEEFGVLFGNPPVDTQLRLCQQMVTKLYPSALKEWADTIKRFDKLRNAEGRGLDAVAPLPPGQVEDDLATWFEDLRVDDGPEIDRSFEAKAGCVHPALSGYSSNLDLYRCSWCGNPSAALRKCGKCAKTRYCDTGCQKSHWKEHKSRCKSE